MSLIHHTKKFYARTHDTRPWQGLSEHLLAVGDGARGRAEKFGAAPWAEAAGLLHDAGKYSDAFQARLAGDPISVDHATFGAQVAAQRWGAAGHIIAGPVAGHHVGLANGNSANTNGERTPLADRLTKNVPDASFFFDQIALPDLTQLELRPCLTPHPTAGKDRRGLQLATLSRMILSCLVDADWSDTSAYCGTDITGASGTYATLADLAVALTSHIDRLSAGAVATPLNRVRADILASAQSKAALPPGVYTLTVPTGGGKTLSGMSFALDHAIHNRLDRVIYVAPYTAIIDQTADVLRGALSPHSESVVEHHTGFREPRTQQLRMLVESWSAPIVVTTAVQFFESLFTDRPARSRKLHNISRSVVMLDEAQTMPVHLLRPCVAILDELSRNYGTTIILCTATQPALTERPDAPRRSFVGGFRDVGEIAPDPNALTRDLRRFTLTYIGAVSDTELATAMMAQRSSLAIVNTRRHAHAVYKELAGSPYPAHLSTLMCPKHRRKRLDIIRRRLAEDQPVHLVSTALVEAGVDIDFAAVWRAMAGLDQIAQAGGRCNREGRSDRLASVVTVFDPADDPPFYILPAVAATRETLRRHPDDPLTLDALDHYFRRLYWAMERGDQDGLDTKDILRRLNDAPNLLFPHEDIARDMRLIEDDGEVILIPFDETAENLINQLGRDEPAAGLARDLQPYTVSVYAADFQSLVASRTIVPVTSDEQFWSLADRNRYCDDVGLILDVGVET